MDDSTKSTDVSKPKTPPLPPEIDTPEFHEAWADWVRHRTEIKRKLTPTSVKYQLRKLEKMGHDLAIQSIEQSLENGWCGLFPPRPEHNGDSSRSAQAEEAGWVED